uniref:Uncharacterized protein n=1 Tax=Nelumbo nucifera TaxID=4432 RepID=A0A822YNX4_NELNU|nr:TPA_asm: hypothetical protein HUJ06_012654 [Nelumbo nucifera]
MIFALSLLWCCLERSPYITIEAHSAFAAYFIDYLLHPHDQREEVTVYGSGKAKGIDFLQTM